ncbi:MAG: hypothetical protein EBT06_11300 [Gammaproteobacteria bacterium]|nr:hypothetical protein [Gammaproteobacteria bacterium]NBT45479.1 hypothetical protein [Gammaproteobacteria bacterium]NBY23529.1 hypothetical protein [Gammaproteobacteria bacterium]NDE34552.1 hypothetical protein [Gammaproteobacteria bacterium]NDE56567.1 hypothetical protein [Gammaproteobacteria bacterium]
MLDVSPDPDERIIAAKFEGPRSFFILSSKFLKDEESMILQSLTVFARSGTGASMVLVLALFMAQSSQATEEPRKVPTTTRLVKLYGELESNLSMAILEPDPSKIDDLLTQDFEQRTPLTADNPTPRAEWLAACSKDAKILGAVLPTKMAVRDLGSSVVASFVMVDRNHQKQPLFFVIDVWIDQQGHQQLKNRFLSRIGDRSPPSLCERPFKSNEASPQR